jgi:DNA-binding NarL/FixJ family response regulator
MATNKLSPREADVARLVGKNYSNGEIAYRLDLTEHTVKNYVFRIFDKLGVNNRTELAIRILEDPKIVGMVEPSVPAEKPLGELLGPREYQVAKLVGLGYKNKDVAEALGISKHTVKGYLSVIFNQLRVSNRTDLAIRVYVDSLKEKVVTPTPIEDELASLPCS